MTKLRINVTKEILFKSRMCIGMFSHAGSDDKATGIGANCAISVAIRDLFPDAWIGTDRIFFDAYDEADSFQMFKKGRMVPRSDLPTIAKEFIADFDRKDPEERIKMEPVSFEIEIPDEVIDTINIEEVKVLLTNHPTMELI